MHRAFYFAEFAQDDVLWPLPSSLMDEAHKEKLARCMELFSDRPLISCFGFEMPLSLQPWADLQFRVPLHEENLKSLGQLKHLKGKWCDFASFIDKISASGFLDSQDNCAIWVELDTGSQATWPPEPNFFLEITNQRDMLSQIEQAFQLLKNKPLSSKIAELLRQTLRDGFEIFGVGFMLGRTSDALRISLRNSALMPIFSYNNYLANLGYHYLNQPDLALLERISPVLRTIALEMDVDEAGVHPKMGWSLFTQDSKESWGNLLAHLIKEKLADVQKVDATLSWCGGELLHPEILISSLFHREEHNLDYIYRTINHVKLSTVPGVAPTTKIYLRVQKIEIPRSVASGATVS
jgi:hypothetical protein